MIRLIGLAIVSALPGWPIRRFLYRHLYKFKIAPGARVGMFNLLDIRTLEMGEGAMIRGFGNVFMNVYAVKMGAYSRIGSPRIGLNLFRGTTNKPGYPGATFALGPCSILTLFHYFDLCGDITFGANCVVGGIRCVFFTHTLYLTDFEPITIGDGVYIASNCLFQMGVSVAPRSVIALGSVVVKPIGTSDVLIAGVPAKVVREDYGFDATAALALRRRPYFADGRVVRPAER